MIRTLNGLGNAIYVNTISAGDAIKLSDNSTNQTVNVDISKQTAKTSISDDDVFVLQDTSGAVLKITGANMKSQVDTNFWTYSSPSLRPDNTSDNVLIGTTSNPDNRKLIVDGLSEFKGQLYLKGGTGSVGFINFYDTDKSNHTTVKPQEDVNANITLPNLTDTLVGRITVDTLKNKTLKIPKILDTSDNHNYIFGVSKLTADRSVTLPLLTGDDTFVFENHNQTLSNKSFGNATTFNGVISLNETLRLNGGSGLPAIIDMYDIDGSHALSIRAPNDLTANRDLTLPTATANDFLISRTSSDVLTNKSLSTGSVWNGNTIGVAYGGTGQASYVIGDLLYASATATLSRLAIGSNNTFLMSNGSAPLWSSTLTSVALSSCTGNISQFTNDSSYLTSITTPLTTATNFGTAANGSVAIGKSDQGLNLIGSKIYLDYTKPVSINIISEIVSSDLISYDSSISSMVFGQKSVNAFDSALHSDTVLNLSLTNSAYDITMNSTAGDITYAAPEHHFSGVIKTYGTSVVIGEDNVNPNLELAINHSSSTGNGASFVVFYYNGTSTSQIGDIRQNTNSSVSYNETSDYRLKTDITDFNNCLDIVNKLKVRRYKFINDVNTGINQPFIGFLAHEVNEASTHFDPVVSGKKDERAMWCNKCNSFNCSCGEDCGEMIMKDRYQGIDYGKFTPYCVGAIQELYAMVQRQQEIIDKLTRSSSFKEFKSS